MPTDPEVTAAVKAIVPILNEDHDGLNSAAVAKLVAKAALDAAEATRNKNAKFGAVAQINLPDGELNHFLVGPFSTELKARTAAEGFAWDPKSKTGRGRFMVIPIVNKPADAWDAIRKAHVKHDEPVQAREGIYRESYWENRSQW